MSAKPPCTAVILAAGKGTRMRSELPKVLHPLCGKPMILCAVEAAQSVCDTVVVVLGYKKALVGEHLPESIVQVVLSLIHI